MKATYMSRHPSFRLRSLFVLVVCLTMPQLVAGQEQAERPRLDPMAFPDLSQLEPAVGEQLKQLQQLLGRALVLPGTQDGELATLFGELAKAYHAYGLLEPAATAYGNARRLAPQELAWTYLDAHRLLAAGETENARQAFRATLDLQQDYFPALVHLAEVELKLGRPGAAQAAGERALLLEPQSPTANAVLGQVALSEQRWEQAVQHLESALTAVPGATRLRYPLGLAYRGLGQTDRARELLAQRGDVGIKPPDPLLDGLGNLRQGERVHLLQGRLAFRVGRYREAAAAFAKAVEAKPDSVRARVNLGSALGQAGDQAGAIEQYRAALELNNENATAHFNLAQLLAGQGELEAAIGHLEQSLRLNPYDSTAHLGMGRLLRALGRRDEALPAFTRAAEIAALDETTRFEEVAMLVEMEQYAQAIKRLKNAVALLPSSSPLNRAMVKLLAACPDTELRDGERALEIAQRMVQAEPSADHLASLAMALAELGRCEEAVEWQQRAISTLGQPNEELEVALRAYQQGPPCRP